MKKLLLIVSSLSILAGMNYTTYASNDKSEKVVADNNKTNDTNKKDDKSKITDNNKKGKYYERKSNKYRTV